MLLRTKHLLDQLVITQAERYVRFVCFVRTHLSIYIIVLHQIFAQHQQKKQIMNSYILIRFLGQIKICGCPNEERCQVNEESCQEGQKGKERKEINLNLKFSSVFILILIQSQMLINDFAEEAEQYLFFVYIFHRSLDCELS